MLRLIGAMNKITLPSGWMLRAWHHGASRDWRVQGTARGWLLTDPDGNDHYAATLARVRVLLIKMTVASG